MVEVTYGGRVNIIAEMWFHCLLTQHFENCKFIDAQLQRQYGDGELTPLRFNSDFAYIWETHTRFIIPFRGTHGGGWFSNLLFWQNREGFQTGFASGFKPFWKSIKARLEKSPEKRCDSGGHSRGAPFSLIMSLRAKQQLRRYIKPNLFCSPLPVKKKGHRLLTENKIEANDIISPNDVVDNVGAGITTGLRYGKRIDLPRSEEFTTEEKLKDHVPGWGHAPSEVTDGLIQYFYGRGMTEEAEFLKSKRWIATI